MCVKSVYNVEIITLSIVCITCIQIKSVPIHQRKTSTNVYCTIHNVHTLVAWHALVTGKVFSAFPVQVDGMKLH